MSEKIELAEKANYRYAELTNQETKEILEESLTFLDPYGVKVHVEGMEGPAPDFTVFWKDGPSVESVRNLLPEWAKLPTTQLWRLFSKESAEKLALIIEANGVDPEKIAIEGVTLDTGDDQAFSGFSVTIINGGLKDISSRNFVLEKTPLYKNI